MAGIKSSDGDGNGTSIESSDGDGDGIESSSVNVQPDVSRSMLCIQRRARCKAIQMTKGFLRRKRRKEVNCILKKYPSIGHTIEEYVQVNNVGADRWRRTGLLSFDGNSKNVEQKVTYDRIRKHLEMTYGRSFSFGTVVQLCIPRNRRRKSASRYKSAAQVISRRSRKGFEIKYNPDTHWSSGLYRGLNYIQTKDSTDIILMN